VVESRTDIRVGAWVPAQRRRGPTGRWRIAWAFTLPAIAAFLIFGWYPMVMAFVVAFQNYHVVGPVQWVGWSNFKELLHDPEVLTSFLNSVYYALLTIVLTFWIPIIVSVLLMEMPPRLRNLMMILWFIPVPAVASTVLWKYLYDPNYGLLNAIFKRIGIHNFLWLDSTHWAMFLIVLPGLITYGPGLIYISTLQAVPNELYEAAELDGASFLRKVWAITLPTLRPIITVLLLLSVIGGLQVFSQPYIMTGGGPVFATVTAVLYIFDNAFQYLRFGYADAIAIVLFLLLMGLVILERWLESRRG
jgi:multiple sugar transport system permease protein